MNTHDNGEVLSIAFPRPPSREDIIEDPRYNELRNSALDFLCNRFAHDASRDCCRKQGSCIGMPIQQIADSIQGQTSNDLAK